MPVTSTEDWREARSSRAVDSSGRVVWTAERSWVVHGATTDQEARTATPLDGRQIPAIDTSHSENGLLRCRELPVGPGKGPLVRIVRAVYSTPTDGSFSNNDDPLQQPVEILPDWQIADDPMERDEGDPAFPLITSAEVPFDDPIRREVADIGFTFGRNEPTFPIALALQLKMTVNEKAFTLPGIGVIGPGQGLLRPFKCDGYKVGSSYIRMLYTIWCRADGWRSRRKDQSLSGWARDADANLVFGPFCNRNGTVARRAVALNGHGIPINEAQRFVLVNDQTRDVRPAIAGSVNFPDDYLETTSTAVYMKFHRFKVADWNNFLGT